MLLFIKKKKKGKMTHNVESQGSGIESGAQTIEPRVWRLALLFLETSYCLTG